MMTTRATVAFLALLASPLWAEETRTWSDSSGKHSVVATLVDVEDGQVTLDREGTYIALPLDQLSEADRQFAQSNAPKIITGKVVGVHDGDSITVLDEANGQQKVRLEGIDAPELKQDFGRKAKEALAGKIFEKVVRVKWKERDQYGRVLGHVYVEGHWINQELLEEGWAWHYKYFNKDPRLAAAETKARESKIGLWGSANPLPPWEFRNPSLRKPGAAPGGSGAADTLPAKAQAGKEAGEAGNGKTTAAAPKDETVYVTKSGKKYHREGCRYLSKSKIPMPLSEAAKRYSPCSVCQPPQSKPSAGVGDSSSARPLRRDFQATVQQKATEEAAWSRRLEGFGVACLGECRSDDIVVCSSPIAVLDSRGITHIF